MTITLSIVSHGQGAMIRHLFADLRRLDLRDVEIILTVNIPEDTDWIDDDADLPVRIIRNPTPLGFGANHNQAFTHSTSDVFVVVNPDIRLHNAGFLALAGTLAAPAVGACAPLVIDADGHVQDSARRFPTLGRLLRRAMASRSAPDYPTDAERDVDWVAGMFILFRRDVYQQVGGFDEGYFMYLEDADICRRIHAAGYRVLWSPGVSVIHDAQRASRRDLRHMRWHLASMLRFLFLPAARTGSMQQAMGPLADAD